MNSQEGSSDRAKVVSDVRAVSHPPELENGWGAGDEDWLDGCDTLPAPKGSERPKVVASERPAQETSAPEPADAIVPAPIVNVASRRSEAPTLEVNETEMNDDSLIDDEAPSTSAQVVPIHSERRRTRRKKKARPSTVKLVQKEPVPAQEPKPREGSSWGPWLLLAAVAGVAGLWLATRSGETPPAGAQAAVVDAPNVQAAAPLAPSEPAPPAEVAAAPEPAPEPEAVPPPAVEVTPPTAAEVAPAATAAVAAAPSEDEPARLTAYKAVVEASKSARNCRHRGDASAKVPVIVEFGSDGRVQRTNVKAAFVNPMTSQCIASKFSGLTIAAPGAPLVTTAEVSLR